MEVVTGSFGKFLVYVMKTSFGAVLSLFLSGVLSGFGVAALFKKPKGQEGGAKMWLWKVVVTFSLALAFLSISVAVGKMDIVTHYWPMFVIGLIVGLFLRLFPVFTASSMSVLMIIIIVLACSLVWTLKAFTGKTAVVEVTVSNVRQETAGRVSTLLVRNVDKGTQETYEVCGSKWGISASVALMEDWLIFFGGKTYYRLNSIVGVDGGTIRRQDFHDFSQPAWEELWDHLERNEGTIPGIRAVYEDIVLKTPVPGRTYRIFVDNDGAVVPELIHEAKP